MSQARANFVAQQQLTKSLTLYNLTEHVWGEIKRTYGGYSRDCIKAIMPDLPGSIFVDALALKCIVQCTSLRQVNLAMAGATSCNGTK